MQEECEPTVLTTEMSSWLIPSLTKKKKTWPRLSESRLTLELHILWGSESVFAFQTLLTTCSDIYFKTIILISVNFIHHSSILKSSHQRKTLTTTSSYLGQTHLSKFWKIGRWNEWSELISVFITICSHTSQVKSKESQTWRRGLKMQYTSKPPDTLLVS